MIFLLLKNPFKGVRKPKIKLCVHLPTSHMININVYIMYILSNSIPMTSLGSGVGVQRNCHRPNMAKICFSVSKTLQKVKQNMDKFSLPKFVTNGGGGQDWGLSYFQ